jgi:hypothetical protein
MKYIIGKIIDFKVKGNAVRFYLGNKTDEWGWTNKNYKDRNGNTPDWLKPNDTYYGDDWDDVPYEHNAGKVYDEFVIGVRTYYVDYDWIIIEAKDGYKNSPYSKMDFVKRKIPCIIIIKGKTAKKYKDKNTMDFWLNEELEKLEDVEKFYFGDFLSSGDTWCTDKNDITLP